MIGCLYTAELDEKLSTQERKEILEKIQKTKGVFSAQFTKAAKKPGTVVAVHVGMSSIMADIEKIPGVKSTKPDSHMRM